MGTNNTNYDQNIEAGTKKSNTQYHCLEDVCILVEVQSASTLISRLSELPLENHDPILEEYAKRVEEKLPINNGDDESDSEEDEEENLWSNTNYSEQIKKLPVVDSSRRHRSSTKTKFLKTASLPELGCTEFLDSITFAKEFVTDIILKSEETVAAKIEPSQTEKKISEQIIEQKEESFSYFGYVEKKNSFTSWPTIEEFTVEIGANKIDEYLSSFETDEDWLYVIYYHGAKKSHCSDIHKYQAIYSLPTWRYPIAQATASIYFKIELCKAKPITCIVNVTYQYETFRKQHKPGVFDFQEKWLHYILDSKINFFKTITY